MANSSQAAFFPVFIEMRNAKLGQMFQWRGHLSAQVPLLPVPVTSGLLAQHQQWSGCVVSVCANVYGKTLP